MSISCGDLFVLRPFSYPVACCCILLLVVGTGCAKFETGQKFSQVQTDATTLKIVGPKMLGVIASVCK